MSDSDHVRGRTSSAVNDQIDRETLQRLRSFADDSGDAMEEHVRRLDKEWDVERMLEINAATIGLIGLGLGIARGRRWLVLPAAIFSFLGLHALQGWCPPVPLFRRMGVRTRREIERERYAVKGMRGDFEGTRGRSQAAWRAVR